VKAPRDRSAEWLGLLILAICLSAIGMLLVDCGCDSGRLECREHRQSRGVL